MEASATVTINTLAQAKKAMGERIFNLSAGEPLVETGHYFKNILDWVIEHHQTHYPPVAGIPELRNESANWLNKTYDTNYTAANTLITCGGKFGIYLALQALLNPDDEVIMIAPYWVSYPSMVEIHKGKSVIIPTEEKNQWKVDPEAIQKARTSRSKLLIINNASNPTGVFYTKQELEKIVEVAKKNNLIILSDEVYSGMIYDNNKYTSFGSFKNYSDNIIVAQSCSKNFAMTGWRVGMVYAPEPLIKIMTKLQGQSITGTSIVSQFVALEAMKNSSVIMPEIQKEMQNRRDIFIDTFNELFNANLQKPAASFYAFIPLTALKAKTKSSVEFCKETLDKGNVATVPGLAFGQEGYVRFSFGAKPQELKDALHALANFLK
ncbi:aminotransferase class I/II-fold pyridoxal phosphate-dependent enzyme [Candidatus Peregrinibacteria bacterium]|nr:aminotransferase class I/II-fold pyridoxal phosphate-dependent enzyme [Candidatus Peregrinibacteria bacterium]